MKTTLMQTIARANRVFKDKVNGLIVIINIFNKLEKALSIYGASGGGGDKPIQNKDELKLEIIESIDQVIVFLKDLNIDLDDMINQNDINLRLQKFGFVINAIVAKENTKKDFITRPI